MIKLIVYKSKNSIIFMRKVKMGNNMIKTKEIPFKEKELEMLWQKMATAIRASGTHIEIDD